VWPSRPATPSSGNPLADPRTSDLYFLFEERVPLDYQLAVADPKQKKTFANMFSPKTKKRETNVLPPRVAPGWRDSDFDKMLLHRQKTKKLTLVAQAPPRASVWHMSPDPGSPVKSPRTPLSRQRTSSSGHRGKENEGEGRPGFFSRKSEKVIRRVKTSEGHRERIRKDRENEVDFELRSTSGISSGNDSPEGVGRLVKVEEKWMGQSCHTFESRAQKR